MTVSTRKVRIERPPFKFIAVRFLRELTRPRTLLVGSIVIIILYLTSSPLIYLLRGTLLDAQGLLTLDAFERAYGGHSEAWGLLGTSLKFAAGSAILALAIGGALAYIYVRTDAPLKRLILIGAVGPLIIPGVLYTIAWVYLADNRTGLINTTLVEPVFGSPFFNIYTMWGMIWVQALHSVPIAFFFMMVAFRGMDPSLEESASVSGGRRTTVLRRITLPLLRPAVLGSLLIVFVQSVDAFEVPAILGVPGNVEVFVIRIYRTMHSPPVDYGVAGAYSAVLILICVIGVLFSGLLSRNTFNFQTITGKGFKASTIQLGATARRIASGATIAFFFIGMVMPLAVLFYVSLLPYHQRFSMDAFQSMSFSNYSEIFHLPAAGSGLRTTLTLGFGSATIVIVLAAVAGWFIARTKSRVRYVVDMVAFTPIVIPGIVLGIAVIFTFLQSPIPIYGTIWILLIAYLTKYMPYGMRYSVASMSQMSNELEESATVCGASWSATFRRILLPLASGGLIAGWLYIFVISVRELSTAILLASPTSRPLSVLVFEQYESGNQTIVAAFAVVMVAALSVLVITSRKLTERYGPQRSH